MTENDADAVLEIHTLECGPWRLVPMGNSIYVGRADNHAYRSRNFSTIAECRAYISGFVDCEATTTRAAPDGQEGAE